MSQPFFLSETLILLLLGLPFMHMWLVQRDAQVSQKQFITVLSIIGCWTVFIFFFLRYDLDQRVLGELEFFALPILFAPVIILAYIYRFQLLGKGVSQHILIGVQIPRVIGGVFLIELIVGTMPAIFSIPAGIGDILTGLIALYLVVHWWGRAIPDAAVRFIAFFGIADLIIAVSLGLLSSPTPFQIFSIDAPNPVGEYPIGLIPFFFVPYAIATHIISLAQLELSNRE